MRIYQSHSNVSFSKILFVYFFIGFFSASYAQVDSLANTSYEQLISLYKTAIQKDPKRAFQYTEAAYKIAIAENDSQKIGWSLYRLAKCNTDLSNNTTALEQLAKVVAIGTQLKDSAMLFRGYSLKGNVYEDIGDVSKALKAYLDAKKCSAFAEKSNDLILLSVNIAYIKKLHRDYEDAVAILKENLTLLETTNISPNLKERYELIILMNLADTYLRMKEHGESQYIIEAELYNNIGLEKCSTEKNTVFYYVLLMNKAIIHYEKAAYEESIAFTKEVANYALQNNNEGLVCTTNFYLGKNYFQLKDHVKSIRFLQKAYAIMKTSERTYSNEKELHELLTLNYTSTEEFDKMKFHFEAYTALEKLKSKEDVKIIEEIHQKNDVPSLKDKIDSLDTNLSYQKRRKLLLYVTSALLGILLVGSIVFYKRKVKRIKEKVAKVLQRVNDLEKAKNQNKSISKKDKVTDKKALEILRKLKEFEEKEEFLVQGCTLIYVAEKLNSNTTYLSKVINKYKGKTFNLYLIELRINKALIQLKNDPKLRSYTIKAIAEEFGFKRQETFSRAFKQQTGIYPSQYLKKLGETNTDH